jgi:hypothetical protein
MRTQPANQSKWLDLLAVRSRGHEELKGVGPLPGSGQGDQKKGLDKAGATAIKVLYKVV